MSDALTTSALRSISADMIAEMALGAEDLRLIAQRYGISEDQWRRLEEMPWFANEVLRKRAEFANNGTLFKHKTSIGAEMALDEVLKRVLRKDTADETVLKMFQYLSKLAGHEPQPGAAAAGPGFSIQINIPTTITQGRAPGAAVVDVEATPLVVIDTEKPAAKTIETPGIAGVPLVIPDFDLTNAALTALPANVEPPAP